MHQGLSSATKAFINFKNAIDTASANIDQTTLGFSALVDRLKLMSLEKDREFDRILYLKEIQNYTGYKITSFADLKNEDGVQ